PLAVLEVLMICIAIDVVLVSGYALLFSNASLTRGYLKLRRVFESLFAVFFASAAIELLII
ncbi:MAG: LysE family translocator, partial [Pseudomonadota bacterium]